MQIFQNFAFEQFVPQMKQGMEANSGFKGALYGAAFGAASAFKTMKQAGRDISVPHLVAGAAAGLAYGVMEKRPGQPE